MCEAFGLLGSTFFRESVLLIWDLIPFPPFQDEIDDGSKDSEDNDGTDCTTGDGAGVCCILSWTRGRVSGRAADARSRSALIAGLNCQRTGLIGGAIVALGYDVSRTLNTSLEKQVRGRSRFHGCHGSDRRSSKLVNTGVKLIESISSSIHPELAVDC